MRPCSLAAAAWMDYKAQAALRPPLRGPAGSGDGLRVVPERRGRGLDHASDEAANGDRCGRAAEVQLPGSAPPPGEEEGKELRRDFCGCCRGRRPSLEGENLGIGPWKALIRGCGNALYPAERLSKVIRKGMSWLHRNTSSTGAGAMVLIIIMAIVVIGNVY